MIKTIKSLCAMLVAAALISVIATACGGGGGDSQSSEGVKHAEMPADNASIKILLSTDNLAATQLLIKLSSIKYPNMAIEIIDKSYYELEDEADFLNKVAAEIMAGGGPDIISPRIFKSLASAIENEVFEDLTPYLKADANFKGSDYSDAILNACAFDSQQIFVPLNIQIPLYVTTAQFEHEYGFEGKSLYEIVDIHAQNNISGNPFEHYYEPLFINDYNNKTSGLSAPEFLKFATQRQKLSAQVETKNNTLVPFDKNPLLYVPGMANMDTFATVLTHTNDALITFPALDEQGKFTAYLTGLGINRSSENKQAAYNFLSLAFTMAENIDELESGARNHQDFLSLISPNAYSFYANKAMQQRLFDEQFKMYKTGTVYNLSNSIVDAAKLSQDALVSEYLSFYDKLDRCFFSAPYRYPKAIADYIYKLSELSDKELAELIDKEYDKAKIAITE